MLEYFDAKLPPFRQNKIDRKEAFDINWAEKKLGKWIWYSQEEEHEKIEKKEHKHLAEMKWKIKTALHSWCVTWNMTD